MKDSQWTIAVLVLAALVFVVVFATQYLGTTPNRTAKFALTDDINVRTGELDFPSPWGPDFPSTIGAFIEMEEHTPGHQDYLFLNASAEPVKVGLDRTSCRCSSVELLIMPGDKGGVLAPAALAYFAARSAGPLAAILAGEPFTQWMKKQASITELLSKTESVEVPPGAAGWARLRWKGEKANRMGLEAKLWFDDPKVGKKATLRMSLAMYEPIRAQPLLRIGSMTAQALDKGPVVFPLKVWSSTRKSFTVKAIAPSRRSDPKADAFVVGKPVPLTQAELAELERHNNTDKTVPVVLRGRVLSGWRIPIILQPVAPDGKTPFDIGPIHRHVLISSPEAPDSPALDVLVLGRVRGLVEIGNEDKGELDFGAFRRVKGSRREMVTLIADSSVEAMKIDTTATSKFLAVSLSGPEESFGRRIWTLTAQVPPDKAVGDFPRKDDPAYEDAAVYLAATVKGKPGRRVRVAVTGTAGE